MARPVGGLRKHPHGRVDQLEDRYLGMVEAPSSNLGTSTIHDLIMNHPSQCWPCCHDLTGYCLAKSLARHVHQKQHTTSPSDPGNMLLLLFATRTISVVYSIEHNLDTTPLITGFSPLFSYNDS